MLKQRLISAALLITTAVLFVCLDAWAYNFGRPGLWLLPLGFCLMLGSAVECIKMVGRSDLGSITVPALLGTVVVMLSGCIELLWPCSGSAYPIDPGMSSLEWPWIASVLVMVGCFVYFFPGFQVNSGSFQRAMLSGWVSCYFGIGFSAAIALRMLGPPSWGLFVLIGFILVTKLADTGAYFTGRAIGRTKLCPSVSPNKTVEGFAGGTVLASIGAWLYFGPFADWMLGDPSSGEELHWIGWTGVIALGVGLTVAGLLGDLLESVFKREFGVKDSGAMLPGLGGFWDVTDSLLPALAVGYLIARWGLVVPPGH